VAHLPAIRLLSTTWATTCGLSLQGEVWCWGENSSGQVGIPIPRVPVRIPAPVRFRRGGGA
jgi:alpha-tubulin suppressor-like RCC1 family protein